MILESVTDASTYAVPGIIGGSILSAAYMLGRTFKKFFDDALTAQKDATAATRELVVSTRALVDTVKEQSRNVETLVIEIRRDRENGLGSGRIA